MVTALLARRSAIENATRRQFLAVLGSAGLLTACSGDGGGEPGGSTDLRPFVDALGRQVDIPTRPERIVSLHEATNGAAFLSVGAPVVGMVLDDELPERPYDLSGIRGVGTFAEPDLEAISAVGPDLIVTYSVDGTSYPDGLDLETLQRIAPTVAFDDGAPLDENMAVVATLTGRVDEVDRQRADYLDELAGLRAAVPQAAELTIAVAGFDGSEIYVFAADNSTPSVAIPQAIGVRPAEIAQRESTNGLYVQFSAERLADDLRADVLLYDSFGEQITRSPLWAGLPAVRAGQAHLVPTVFGASYAGYRRLIPPLRDILQGARPL